MPVCGGALSFPVAFRGNVCLKSPQVAPRAQKQDEVSSSPAPGSTLEKKLRQKTRVEVKEGFRLRNSIPQEKHQKKNIDGNAAQSSETDKELERKLKAVREKRKQDRVQAKLRALIPCCYGCGAPLQYTEEGSPGYIDAETYKLKEKHHQLKKSVLCIRCQQMCHGKLIPAVGGYGIYGREKCFVTAEELRAQLAHLREEKVLVLKLVDIVDFSGSFINRVRDLVGSNPIVLVATKVDLLPAETDLAAVGDWIVETTLRKKLNVISIHLTSAKFSMGIANIVKEIQRERQGRDVYILGAANVGKSAFIDALLKEMGARDPIAAAARRHRPIQSVLPGTTVGHISIDAFASGGCVYDTPGVHLHHRIETAVSPDDLPSLFPARRLRGFVVSSSSLEQKSERAENIDLNLSGKTIFWGGIARVDVLKAPENTKVTFYASSAIKLHTVPTSEADEFYKNELGKTLSPPSGEERASAWGGLIQRRKFSLEYDKTKPVAGDIAISGLGWISVELAKKDGGDDKESLELQVRVPKGVEAFLRPPMPVGEGAKKWYSFKELSEEEEKTRPRLYYSKYRER